METEQKPIYRIERNQEIGIRCADGGSMKTAELEGQLLDYHVALAMGHVWRRPRDEFEGYNAWQAYEQAFGNPTPPYSTDWAVGGPILEKFGIGSITRHAGTSEGFYAAIFSVTGEFVTMDGASQLNAGMRALVASVFGYQLPDIAL